MKLTKKDIWLTVVVFPLAVVLGLGVSAVIPESWKADFALLGLLVTFFAFFCLLRFPAIAPKLHRNLVKNLGLKTDH